jgi:hypothetical protein
MKKIAIAVALAVAVGGLGFPTSADAAKQMQVNAKSSVVAPKRSPSAA